MKKILWAILILLPIVSIFGSGWYMNQAPNGPPSKDTAAEKSPTAVWAIGFVDAADGVADLYPSQQGEIIKLIAEGKSVEAGDLLLEVDSRMQRLLVEKAEAALKAAQDKVKEAQLLPKVQEAKKEQQEQAIEAAREEKKALNADLKNKLQMQKNAVGNVTEFMLTAVKSGLARAEAKIKSEQALLKQINLQQPDLDIQMAKNDVAIRDADLKSAKLAVDECKLNAPSKGTVLRVLVHKGERLGANPRFAAIQFIPAGDPVIKAEVIQEWGHFVKTGQKVVVEDDTYRGPKWEGEIREVAKTYQQKRDRIMEPFMVNDVRTLQCIIHVQGGGRETKDRPPLRIGQRVRVKINVEPKAAG